MENGFDLSNIKRFRQFYSMFPKSDTTCHQLSWTHIRLILRIKDENENKTIGILVCEEKNNAVVKITLPEDNKNIFAIEYKKYLPNKKELQNKVKEVIEKHNYIF